MTCQAYAGPTSSVAVTAGKGLVGVWCYGCTVFPPLTFFLYGRPPGGFEGGGSFAYSATPCAAVFGEGSPLKMADVARTKGLFSSPGTNVLGELMPYPRRRRRCRRRQFQVKVSVY